jgi:hypothetical protein
MSILGVRSIICAVMLASSGLSVSAVAAEVDADKQQVAELRFDFRRAVINDFNFRNVDCHEKLLPEDQADFDAQMARHDALVTKIKASSLAYDFDIAVEDAVQIKKQQNLVCAKQGQLSQEKLSEASRDLVKGQASASDRLESSMVPLAGYVSPRVNPKLAQFNETRALFRSNIGEYKYLDNSTCIFAPTPALKAANAERIAVYDKLTKTLNNSSLRLDFEAALTQYEVERKTLGENLDCSEFDPPSSPEELDGERKSISKLHEIVTFADMQARTIMGAILKPQGAQ